MSLSVQVTVTVPELVLNSTVIRNAIYRALRTQIGPQMHKLFNQTVEGWSDKPAFHESGHNWLSEVSVRVWTYSRIYAYVNNGVDPHPIPRSGTTMMNFRKGYSAGTRPRILSSRRPTRFGEYVTAFRVNHPGIEARDFDVEIAEQVLPDLIDAVNEAIGLGLKLAG